MEGNDSLVLCGIFIKNLTRSIGGAVVYSKNDEILVALGEDGVETFPEIACRVVYREDNGYFCSSLLIKKVVGLGSAVLMRI